MPDQAPRTMADARAIAEAVAALDLVKTLRAERSLYVQMKHVIPAGMAQVMLDAAEAHAVEALRAHGFA